MDEFEKYLETITRNFMGLMLVKSKPEDRNNFKHAEERGMLIQGWVLSDLAKYREHKKEKQHP